MNFKNFVGASKSIVTDSSSFIRCMKFQKETIEPLKMLKIYLISILNAETLGVKAVGIRE